MNVPPVNQPPLNRPPRVVPEWQRRLLENWTGLVGLAVLLLGLGFLAVYGAAVVNPFGRFLLIVAAAALSMAGGVTLVRYRPRWTKWGYWLQSFGAAVFLFGCLGSGGIPGVAWVTDPLTGLGLLLFGAAVNLALGWYRRQQPYLTLHVVLALVALSVAEPSPVLVLALWTTAFLGLALSWFQRWAYHRAVVIAVVQAILTAAYWRAEHDPLLQWMTLGASASLAILVHLASYRRLEQQAWSRPSFVTHVLNALAAAVTCALWSPHLPMGTALVLLALAAGLVALTLRARATGTTWLYRTDRVLALAVAGIVLVLNPAGALPLVLGAVFVLLVLALGWTARLENDAMLERIASILTPISSAALAALSMFQYRADTSEWLWQTGAVYLALAGAALWVFTARERSSWHTALEGLLAPAFLMPLVVLWLGERSPVPGLSPGWVLILPVALLATAYRRAGREAPVWSLLGTTGFTVVLNWFSWLGQGRLWGDPWPTLVWGGGAALLAIAAVTAAPPRTARFLTASLIALGSAALLAWLTLEPVHPAWSMAALAVLFAATLAFDLGRYHSALPAASAAVLAAALAVTRLAWALQAPGGWIALGCDLVAAGLLTAAALSRRTGPSWFWEGCLVWLIWTVWFDLPSQGFAVGLGVLAVGALAAGRWGRQPRLDWESAVLFLLAGAACLASAMPFKVFSVALLIAYLVLDSLVSQRVEEPRLAGLRSARRYVLVFAQAAVLALALPSFVGSTALTLAWSIEAALVFFLAVVWKDEIFKNTALAGLGICLIRLVWVDLSASDILTKALTFLSVGALMVGMNVLYLWSKNRKKNGPEDNS